MIRLNIVSSGSKGTKSPDTPTPSSSKCYDIYNKLPQRFIRAHWWTLVTYYWPRPSPLLNGFSGSATDCCNWRRLDVLSSLHEMYGCRVSCCWIVVVFCFVSFFVVFVFVALFIVVVVVLWVVCLFLFSFLLLLLLTLSFTAHQYTFLHLLVTASEWCTCTMLL